MVKMDAGIIPRGGRILAGVSGGADSMALMHLLHALRHDRGIELIIVHYDHALRRGSSKDRLFVQRASRELGLQCVTERNTSRPPAGASVEDFARQKRFSFFLRTARDLKADALVLAHTQDDLAETVLMRLLRGTGLAGLRSILPQRHMQGVLFVRPMLDVTRKDVEAFLKKNRIDHVEDPTNAGDDFLRNRVRHKLLPFIAKEFSTSVKQKLAEMAIIAAVDHDLIGDRFEKTAARFLTKTSSGVDIALPGWRSLPAALRRMAVCEAGAMVLGREGVITFQHVLMIEKAALEGKACHFPLTCGLVAVLSKKILKVIKIS